MTSFDDDSEVIIDWDENEFSIVSNSGRVRTYDIDAEKSLLNLILDTADDIEITEVGRSYEVFEREVKDEYKEKFGEDFEDWRW